MTDTIAAPRVTEKQFQAAAVEYAELLGWKVYHPWSSLHSAAGWPDLALCRPPRLLLVELKSETGTLTPAQAEWGELLGACEGVEYHVCRPSSWDDIERALAGGDARERSAAR